jgi:1-acyl-sn-glycerol-3-phosphate acyltransferase
MNDQSSRVLPDGTPWPHPFGYAMMPELPPSAPRRGYSRLTRWLGRTVMRLMGFRLMGPYPDVPKLVVAAAPHTSNWDGIVGIAALLALDIDVRIMGKNTLFRGPSGWILRQLHAIPVDRSAPGGIVGQMVLRFAEEERFVLGVTPEGTRKKVETWKTGFYRIAEAAGAPILPVALDFGRKEIRLGPTLIPTGDINADFGVMKAFFATAQGENPENA